MKAIEHQGKGLLYLTIEPDDYGPDRDYPLMILLHGFGANMQDLATLAPAISRDGYIYACPQGPLAFELAPGQMGYAWMPPPPPRGPGATAEDSRRAEELLDAFFQEVLQQYRVPVGRVLLGGFSQGGRMTYQCGLRQPEVFAGLAGLSASLPDPQKLKDRLPPDRSQPIFIAHGQDDPLVSVESARKARDFLEAEGYKPRYIEYVMGHQITSQVISDLVAWMAEVLPPLDATSA